MGADQSAAASHPLALGGPGADGVSGERAEFNV
jgi:hypothetical protein